MRKILLLDKYFEIMSENEQVDMQKTPLMTKQNHLHSSKMQEETISCLSLINDVNVPSGSKVLRISRIEYK